MTLSGHLMGPEFHISEDRASNEQPIEDFHPIEGKYVLNYPKWKYHKNLEPIIVDNEDAEKALEGEWLDAPYQMTEEEEKSAIDDSLEAMSRQELVAYASEKYGISLDGRKKHDDLVAVIEEAAAKAEEATQEVK